MDEPGPSQSLTARTLYQRWRLSFARTRRYDVFLSHRRLTEGELAAEVQAGLGQLARPFYRPNALRVFRDITDLHASEDLPADIERALSRSRALVVMCSPATKDSPWIRKEIEIWLELRRKHGAEQRPIWLALADGELEFDDGAKAFDVQRSTALDPVLVGVFTANPSWVDLRKARKGARTLEDPEFRAKVAALAAPLHGVSVGELIGEDHRQHRISQWLSRAVTMSIGTLLVLATYFGIQANEQRFEAEQRRNQAEYRGDVIARQRDDIEREQEQTQRALFASEARRLAAASLETERPQLAALLAAEAWQRAIGGGEDARAAAEHALRASLVNLGPLGKSVDSRMVESLHVADGHLFAVIDGSSLVVTDLELQLVDRLDDLVAIRTGASVAALGRGGRLHAWERGEFVSVMLPEWTWPEDSTANISDAGVVQCTWEGDRISTWTVEGRGPQTHELPGGATVETCVNGPQGSIVIVDFDGGRHVLLHDGGWLELPGEGSLDALAFDEAKGRVLVPDDDRLWWVDLDEGERKRVARTAKTWITQLVYDAKTEMIVVGDEECIEIVGHGHCLALPEFFDELDPTIHISPRGDFVAYADGMHGLAAIDVERHELEVLLNHPRDGEVDSHSLAHPAGFDLGGQWLVSTDDSADALVWGTSELASNELDPVTRIRGHDVPISALLVHDDQVYSGDEVGMLRRTPVESPSVDPVSFTFELDGRPMSVADPFSAPKLTRVGPRAIHISGSNMDGSRTMLVWPDTGRIVDLDTVDVIARSATGDYWVTRGAEGLMLRWIDTFAAGIPLCVEQGGPGHGTATFDPGGERLAVQCGGELRVWDVRAGTSRMVETDVVAEDLLLSPNGALVILDQDGRAHVAKPNGEFSPLEGDLDPSALWISSAELADEKGSIINIADGTRRSWTPPELILQFGGPPGDYATILGEEGMRIWDTASRTPSRWIDLSGLELSAATLSADGKTLLACSSGPEVLLIRDGDHKRFQQLGTAGFEVALTADGSLGAVAAIPGSALLRGDLLIPAGLVKSSNTNVALTGDGRWAAFIGIDVLAQFTRLDVADLLSLVPGAVGRELSPRELASLGLEQVEP